MKIYPTPSLKAHKPSTQADENANATLNIDDDEDNKKWAPKETITNSEHGDEKKMFKMWFRKYQYSLWAIWVLFQM